MTTPITTRRNLLLGAAALACTAQAARAESATLNVSHWMPLSHPLTLALTAWTGDVEKATSSRVKFRHLPRAVAAPPATYNAIRDGLAELSFAVQGYTPGRFVFSEFSELPLGGGVTAEANSVALQRIVARYPTVIDEFKDVKVLALFNHGPALMFNTQRPVRSLADLKGLKFRVGGGVVNQVSALIDANTAMKSATENYELISSGVMDGTFGPFEMIATFKLDKLIRHATKIPGSLYNAAFVVVMNRKAFDALSAADRESVDKLAGERLARAMGRAFDTRDSEGLTLAKAAGVEIIDAPATMVEEIRGRTADLDRRWIEAAKAKGMTNAEAALREYRAEVQKL
jgi:TRAP-type C4-dicarboxylate transport system substrate-binding protein